MFILILFTFSQITDADSLDYHLGSVLEIIRSNQLEIRKDEWFHFRLIGLGEMINFYGLFFYSLNFGQIFQVLPLMNIFLILYLFNKDKKINYLIVLSFPIIITLLLSAKQILILSNCYLLVFSFILLKEKPLKYSLLVLLFLTIIPIGFKYTYLIYSIPLWFVLIFKFKKEIQLAKFIFFSVIIFLIFPSFFYLKNFLHYGDPITPYFEFLKAIPNNELINFGEDLRHSEKIFNYFEFLFIPILHSFPISLSNITLLASPIVIFCYLLFLFKTDKILIFFLLIVYTLLFFSEKSPSRYFLDLYFLVILFLLQNFNLIKEKRFLKLIIIPIIPYSILTLGMILYTILTLSFPSFNQKAFQKSMHQKAHNYEIIEWINNKTSYNDILMFDTTIRSKSHQKSNFYYYSVANKSYSELIKIVDDKKITKLVISKENYEKKFKPFYKCKDIDMNTLNHATRNPINTRRSIANIYLLDTRCL